MKHALILLALTGSIFSLSAQPVKKYVLIEHFTNSRCSICASRNPAFYNTITPYAADIHHVSIHPPVPYTNCVFYQANTTENSAWADIYDIQGTPRVALNGTLVAPGNPLLPASTLQANLNQTSPLYVKVTESGAGASRTATVELRSAANIPSGTYKVYVAVLEKLINQTTPNGETVHRDVFRKMLTSVNGDAYTPAATGASVVLNYNYNVPNTWNSNEVYVVAFVKNTQTGEVLNSGTRFDPIVSSTGQPADIQSIALFPNPATETSSALLPDDEAIQTEVFSFNGAVLYRNTSENNALVNIPVAALPKGIYLVRITGKKAVYSGKLLRN
jgi:hypothetical protein